MEDSKNIYSFTNLPETSSLLCINAVIEKGECIKISTYNSIIIKCRQLLFENQDIIAYPELDQSYCIVILVKENFYTEGKLRQILRKYNLKITGPPKAVLRYTYERCCYYTILTKIAPQWNTIANYFVKGRDFLMNSSPSDCTYLTIRITESGETTFIFNTGRVKLPTMSVKSLDLAYKHLHNLNTKQFTEVFEHELKPVRVLPSLKKGKIIAISQSLSHSKTFSEYKYMKRYWKNTYGYRLPEQDSELVYFDIKFFDGSPIFTYPLICVRPYNPVFLKKMDSEEIVNEFMADMIKAVPILLGENYKTPVFGRPNIALINATQILNNPAMLYTQGNHFDINQNISDTQNSAIVFMQTLKTQYKPTQNESSTHTQNISQFIKNLEKEQLLSSEENDEDTNNNTETSIDNEKTKEVQHRTEDINKIETVSVETKSVRKNDDAGNQIKNKMIFKNNPFKNHLTMLDKENIKPSGSGEKRHGMVNNVQKTDIFKIEKGKSILKKSCLKVTNNRYKSLNITIESQNEDFGVKKKKKS